MSKRLYYAEVDIITSVMKADRKLKVISDGALFIVTDEKNKENYGGFDWWPVEDEAMEAYNLK